MDQSINLRLEGGNTVIPSTHSIKVQPGDTIEFTSQDGDVDIKFVPDNAVEPGPKLGSKRVRVTVRKVPFEFRCFLIKPDQSRVGWSEQQREAGGTGDTGPH